MDRAISGSKGIDKRETNPLQLRFIPKYTSFIGVLNFKKNI